MGEGVRTNGLHTLSGCLLPSSYPRHPCNPRSSSASSEDFVLHGISSNPWKMGFHFFQRLEK